MKQIVFYDNQEKKATIQVDLIKDTVMEVYTTLKQYQNLKTIDLSLVKKVDTSALALLIECKKTINQQLQILNPPNFLKQLAILVETDFLFHP